MRVNSTSYRFQFSSDLAFRFIEFYLLQQGYNFLPPRSKSVYPANSPFGCIGTNG